MPAISLKMDISALKSGASQANSTLDAIAKKADGASASTDQLGSSIASAAKQVLALVGAYKALEGMKGFVRRGIEFNSTIEQSRIGMASLIATMAKLQDEQGRTLEGAEKYAAAQSVAADMMKEIQRLGLETTATTQELVQGVQNVMGSALNAGLKLEQIPKFAVTAAQAMQALGIPLEQMRTELDALLTGKIDSGDDILVQRLGLTKQNIESWREQDVLFDKLMEKMAAFELAGKDVAQTWRGLTSNFSEAMDMLAGQSAQGISGNLKEVVSEFQKLLLTTEGGSPRISEDFEQIAKVITRLEDALGGNILSAAQGFASAVRGINDSIGEMGGTEALWGRTETAIATVSAALASLTVVRKAGVAEGVKANQQQVAAYEQSKRAAQEEAKATYEAAKAAREAAAEEARLAQLAVGRAEERVVYTREISKSAVTARQQARALSQQGEAWRDLSSAQATAKSTSDSLKAADIALSKAEANLEATTKAATSASTARGRALAASSALWTGAVDTLTAGATRLGSALKALWAGLGGGVGVAITAITAGITYLATRQDDAARATELHTQAQKDYEAVAKSAADETGKLSGKLSELEKQRLAAAKTKAGEAYQLQMKELSSAIDSIVEKQERLRSSLSDVGVESGGGLVPAEYLDTLKGMMALLETGSMSVDEFQEQLANLRSAAVEAGYGNSEFVKTLDQINAKGGVADTLLSIAKTLGLVSSNAREAASGIREASAAANSIKGLDEALKQSEFVKFTGKLSAEKRSAASFLESTAKLTKSQITAALSGDFSGFSVEDAKKIRAIISNVSSGKAGGASSTASSIQSAQRSIAELRREIEQMQGSSTKTVSDLAKKFEDIAKAGKAAGLSAEQVRSLQQEYKDAFQAKTLEDFNKELLQVQGNTTALKNIQITETLRGWTQQFQATGMTAEQYAPKIAQLKTALEQQQGYKDLQTAADFYRELGDLSGEYGESLEYQNRLIEEKTRLYKESGIPEELALELEALKKLETARDPFSGFVRTTNKYFADATNWAQQLGSIWGNTMDGMTDALTEFCMTGKLNFNDLANSFIQQVIRMQMQAAVSGLFKGGTGLVGGLFGSGGNMGSLVDTASSAMQAIPGIGHSGWYVGREVPADGFRSVPAMAFAGAPRLHSGGGWFARDEYPAILQRGERVLNRDETAAYHAGMQAGGYGGAVNVPVNVIIENKSGEELTAQKTSQHSNAQGGLDVRVLVTRVVVDDVTGGNGGPIAKAMQSIYGVKRLARGR
ncbi:phage tail tape measure C-terminal domain-containing protein [Desulfovibrio piger]|uniref:phage tail tape measure C-terminal domain-containing protein n=1 Tax=Desulfovibrio piger TaxID=901 RepID=UPI0026EE8763|nr:phage tail tape measure C-terminal domain-containing protein [Desulfovibrio piger]